MNKNEKEITGLQGQFNWVRSWKKHLDKILKKHLHKIMLPCPKNGQGIHSQKPHFEHTSKGKTNNPKSTNWECYLQKW